MKRIRLGLAGLILTYMLTGCGLAADGTVVSAGETADGAGQEPEDGEESGMDTTSWEESLQKMFEDPYGDYRETGGEIVLLTDGPVEDGGYNEAVYNGVRMYALGAGKSFSYYNANPDDLESYRKLVERSVQENAGIIVCVGDTFGQTVGGMQESCPQTSFLLIDSVPHSAEGEALSIAPNVHCVLFHEEQAGYLAGYMAVWEGYRNLGFVGGKEEPAVMRYGYGYLQGIDAAAKDLSLDDVVVKYWYAGTFLPDIAVREKADGWYESGTQVIFACGGGIYESVLEAAENQDGLLIGADVDQARVSDRFLTSAVKNINTAVTDTLDSFYADRGWSEAEAGQVKRYGVEEGCAAIPVVDTEWRFKEVSTTLFFEIYKQMKRGDRAVSDDISAPPSVAVTVNFE